MLDKAKDLYKLRKEAKKVKGELKKTHIEAEVDGVTFVIDGEQKPVDLKISDEALQNKSKLEKSIIKAFEKALEKSQKIGAEMMKGIMGDMNLPGM
ncbi:hypothetical protein GF354_00690 [Candidatus Peregrinibacteria bacterium]|nr:hypothetical protein [Candidatus Peregrinibacteria bacterium]